MTESVAQPLVNEDCPGHHNCIALDGDKLKPREVAQTRNTFDNGEKRCQGVVVSTNSNGEDVAATLARNLAKQTGAQQQNGGGVRVSTPRGFCLDRFGQYGDREIASAMKMRDYKDHTDLVVHEKEGAEGE